MMNYDHYLKGILLVRTPFILSELLILNNLFPLVESYSWESNYFYKYRIWKCLRRYIFAFFDRFFGIRI